MKISAYIIAFNEADSDLYGIIQGGIYEDLREESIEYNLRNLDVFGIAIGGSLGSTKEQMYKVVNFVIILVPIC